MSNESNLPAGRQADTHPPGPARGPGYEVRDTNVRVIVVFLAGLVLFLVACQVGLWGLLQSLHTTRSDKGEPFDPAPSAPEVIYAQHRQLRAYEADVLAGKGPAERDSVGQTRIPIDRAIELLAERGVPPTPGPPRTEEEVNGHAGTPVPERKAGANNNDGPAGGRDGSGAAGKDQRGKK